MTFDHGGDGEPRGNAQLGLHHHPRVVHPPLKRRRGKLCCLSARPPDLADMISARPEVACVPMSYVSCVHSKRAALTRALVSFFTNERFVHVLVGPLVEPPRSIYAGDPWGGVPGIIVLGWRSLGWRPGNHRVDSGADT